MSLLNDIEYPLHLPLLATRVFFWIATTSR